MADLMHRVSEKERLYVNQVLDGQFRASCGHAMATRLENEFCRVFGSRFAVSFINGTATLHAALSAAGIGQGDEVIVPPLTMASTAMAVCQAGAIPVFADIDPHSWTIDPKSILNCITTRTKAIIPVAVYGLAPDMDAIMAIARDRGLLVIEDDAQCFLGYDKGKIVGRSGHAASFSFQSSKHITSGEGGMIITDDAKLALAIRRFSSLGYRAVWAGQGKISKNDIQDPGYLRHASIGWNYRMPELCAAVALAQVERLAELVEARIKTAELFALAVDDCDWLVPQQVSEHLRHSYWSYVLLLQANAPVDWYDFRHKYIELGGDGFYGAWQLTYLEPAFKGRQLSPHQPQVFGMGLCPVAESIQPRLIQLKTNYWDPTMAQVKADALRRTIKSFG